MILGALEQLNLFGPSNKVLYLKKLVIKSGVSFLILFVLVDAILQKVVYFKKTRKLSLYSEENDEAMVDLGDAIRSGDATYVFEMIEANNGIESSALSRRGLQFEITLRKETKAELLMSKSITG